MKRKPAKEKAHAGCPLDYSVEVNGVTHTFRVPIDHKRYIQFVGTVGKAKRGDVTAPIRFSIRQADSLKALSGLNRKARRKA